MDRRIFLVPHPPSRCFQYKQYQTTINFIINNWKFFENKHKTDNLYSHCSPIPTAKKTADEKPQKIFLIKPKNSWNTRVYQPTSQQFKLIGTVLRIRKLGRKLRLAFYGAFETNFSKVANIILIHGGYCCKKFYIRKWKLRSLDVKHYHMIAVILGKQHELKSSIF